MLEVREFDIITCNKDYENSPYFRYLDKKHFEELERFIREYSSEEDHADALEFMKIGYKRNVGDIVSFNSNVGIIELPSGFQIEILPKVSFDEDETNNTTKKVFLNMLRCLREFEGKAFGNAVLNADRMNLYEIFIKMFLDETQTLVKHGIKSSYITKEDNIAFYKGKLQVSQHIKVNMAHKERFYMQFDEYQVNRPENRLVKATLLKLQKVTNSFDNDREIRQLLTAFEFVDASVNYEKDFSMVSAGRDMKEYALLLQWARVFLQNKSFTTFSGEKVGKALLFPMEKVFEAFVAKWIRSVFSEKSCGKLSISAQDSGYYLFDNPNIFRLRPDIVIREGSGEDKKTIVMDTKWKKLKPDARVNYGISQADMYQMYAYSKKYHTSEIWLLYPYYPDVEELKGLSFSAIRDEECQVNVHVFFIDLLNYRESILELYNRAFYEALIVE